jgi:hypothetical protein
MTEAQPRLDRMLVIGLFLAYVLAAAHTTIATDTARDLIAAWDIVQGTQFPLRGPELYTTWTLGPIWYYLLALPLALTHSAAAAVLLVAVLAAMKFPLAYWLGAEFGGRALARLSMIALAVPGWWMFEWLVTSHTNLAVPCLLGYAIYLLRWARNGSMPAVMVAAGLFSLSVHAHPTSLFWIWLWVPALWSRFGARHTRLSLHLSAALLMFLLPFAPMIFDEAQTGWPMLKGTLGFVAAREGPSWVTRLWPFLSDLMAIDRARMTGQFLPDVYSLRLSVASATIMLWALALIGITAGVKWLALRITLLLVPLAGSIFVLWLRPEVPYWMVYALAPATAALLALGWRVALDRMTSSSRVFAEASLSGVVIALFLLFAANRWVSAGTGWINVPYRVVGRYADANRQIDTRVPNAAFPVAGQEIWVRWLCRQSNSISLHGDAAAMQRMSQGILHALHCADDKHWQIGGSSTQAVALYPLFALRALPVTPMQTFGAMARLPVVAILRAALPQQDDLVRAYPPWPLTQQPDQEISMALGTEVEGLIAVSNLRVVFNGLAAPEVVIDGQPLQPVTRSASTWFFLVPKHRIGALQIRSGDLRWIEVLQLDAGQ